MKIVILLALTYLVWSCATTRTEEEPKSPIHRLGPNKW